MHRRSHSLRELLLKSYYLVYTGGLCFAPSASERASERRRGQRTRGERYEDNVISNRYNLFYTLGWSGNMSKLQMVIYCTLSPSENKPYDWMSSRCSPREKTTPRSLAVLPPRAYVRTSAFRAGRHAHIARFWVACASASRTVHAEICC